LLTKWRALPLMWTEALRALVCLLPMIVATALDRTTYLVTLGQGAFFFSSLFLPRRIAGRFVMGSLVLALGLGSTDRRGGSPPPLGRVIFTFFVCLNLSFRWMEGRRTAQVLTPDDLHRRAQHRLTGKRRPPTLRSPSSWAGPRSSRCSHLDTGPTAAGEREPGDLELASRPSDGHRHRPGPGHLLYRRIRQDRLGPQRRGNVVRYDEKLSEKRARARFFGTLGGAAMVAIAPAFITDPTIVV
jgi:hypothetical protein